MLRKKGQIQSDKSCRYPCFRVQTQFNVLSVNVLSRASSTSTSVTFRFPSRESFSVMMSEGTSSLTVSPSSSDLASQHSHGKMTVSEP